MPSATYNLFRRAILQRKQILCTYQAFYRETCPYTLGYRHGQEKALVFQFAGESSQRLPPAGEWRCFSCATCSNCLYCDLMAFFSWRISLNWAVFTSIRV